MRVWCGAVFPWEWDPYLDSRPEVETIPSCPADGSVQIIYDTVIVKF